MEKDIDLNATGSSVEALAIRYGLYITAGLIAYFLLMKLLGLVLVVELRALNLLFLLTGIILALRAFKRQHGLFYLPHLVDHELCRLPPADSGQLEADLQALRR